MTNLLRLFADSPWRPVTHHMEKVHLGMLYLNDFFRAVEAQQWSNAWSLQQEIGDLQRQAMEIKQQILAQLTLDPLKIFRQEVFALLQAQEGLLQAAKIMVTIFTERELILPTQTVQSFLGFMNAAMSAVEKAKILVDQLDGSSQQDFGRENSRLGQRILGDMMQLVVESEEIQAEIRQELFLIEAERGPVEMMFLYRILEEMGKLITAAFDVSQLWQTLKRG